MSDGPTLPADTIRIGMPQLAHAGLSEHWLLRECGDRHWCALAARLGLADPVFADDTGRTAYAAFLGLRLAGARLDAVREHDRLRIDTRLQRLGPARHLSVHGLSVDGRAVGRLELLSTFVRRATDGDNRSVARVSVPADTAQAGADPGAVTAHDPAPLATRIRALRDGFHPGTEGLIAPAEPRDFRLAPCPRNDFNGAEFLYFASFAALLDRAAWAWWREPASVTTAGREIAYFGNLNPGETLHIALVGLHRDGPGAGHACELRAGDGRLLARAITRRAITPATFPPRLQQ